MLFNTNSKDKFMFKYLLKYMQLYEWFDSQNARISKDIHR